MKTRCYQCGKLGDDGNEPCILFYTDKNGKIIKKEATSDIICSDECREKFGIETEKMIRGSYE